MLTSAQQSTLAAHIRANQDATVSAALAIRNDAIIAEWYNAASTFYVWRTEVPVDEYRDNLVWTEVDGLTTGKARIWEWVTGQMTLPLQPHKTAVRQGLADCWAANTDTRTQLLAIAKRLATKAENLFTTGTGTAATPGDLAWEGILSTNDVSIALNNNP